MTGAGYRDLIASYIVTNFAANGLVVYTEISLGKTIIGKDRKIDVFVLRASDQRAIAIECKFQEVQGTTDEKIPYALQDLEALWIPGCIAYAGEGWSRGVLHTLEQSRLAAYCLPDATTFARGREVRLADGGAHARLDRPAARAVDRQRRDERAVLGRVQPTAGAVVQPARAAVVAEHVERPVGARDPVVVPSLGDVALDDAQPVERRIRRHDREFVDLAGIAVRDREVDLAWQGPRDARVVIAARVDERRAIIVDVERDPGVVAHLDDPRAVERLAPRALVERREHERRSAPGQLLRGLPRGFHSAELRERVAVGLRIALITRAEHDEDDRDSQHARALCKREARAKLADRVIARGPTRA